MSQNPLSDPTRRILSTDRLSTNFISNCCYSPITWDIDFSTWDGTNEIWGNTYFNTTIVQIYIGP